MTDATKPVPSPQAIREFVLELENLTRKYGVAVGGCGCCGSPWVEPDDVSDSRSGYALTANGLIWVTPADEYIWDRDADDIVRNRG